MRVPKLHGIEARHIDPGSPWQNGIDERFNGTLRRELLDRETFHSRDHARALVNLYARSYTPARPHSSLGYQTPAEFHAKRKRENPETGEEEKDGFAGGEGMDLSLGAPPARREADEPASANEDRPVSRQAIHVGARVASQRCPILRVDELRLDQHEPDGKVSSDGAVKIAGRL